MKLRGDVIALGDTTAGDLLWRVAGRLHVTVVVKATFKLVANGRMTLHPHPQPMHERDVMLASGDGVVAPSDLVPYLGMTDVVVCGGARHAGVSSQIVLRRDKATVLDKMAPVARLGAVASKAPARRGMLKPAVWRALEQEVPDLPVDMDWSYFQAALLDQQVSFLTGSEWLLLRGLTAGEMVRSQLPGASGTAWVWPRGGSFDSGYPVAMFADRLVIDGDAETVTFSWRGAIPLSSVELLSQLHVAAGVHMPGKPIDWTEAKAQRGAVASGSLQVGGDGSLSMVPAPAVGVRSTGPTKVIEPDDADERPLNPALAATVYFVTSGAAADEHEDELEGTLGVVHVTPAEAAAPFPLQTPGAAAAPRADAALPFEIPGDEDEGELEGTVGIAMVVDPDQAAPFPLATPQTRRVLSLVPLPGAPWAKSGGPPAHIPFVADDDALDGTIGLASSPTEAVAPAARAESPSPALGSSAPLSPWAGGPARPVAAKPPMPGRPAKTLSPPAPPPSDASPAVPERVATAAEPEPASSPVEVSPDQAPAPPEGASAGEEFLAALAWLSDNED